MVEGKKMALIPLDMLQRMNKPDLTPIKNPTQDQLVKTMSEMNNVLHDNYLPDDIKSSRFNEKIKDFTVYSDKITSTPTVKSSTVTPKFFSLPKTFQQPASFLLKELEKFPQRVQWDNNTNELTIDGKRMVGSNLIDLVGDVLRNRKSVSPPMYSNAFLQLLADLNVPEDFIRNKSRLSQFRSLKGISNNNTSWYNSTPTIVDNDQYDIQIPNRKLEMIKRRREESMKSKVKKAKKRYTNINGQSYK